MDKPKVDVKITVNGITMRRSVDPNTSLLRFLRDDLGLNGTKEGCSTGDCGTCVVLVDGKPVDSCLFQMKRANGIRVETIKSLSAPGGLLQPLQAAFLECGAVQCGFCTPGMIMTSKALLASKLALSIVEGLILMLLVPLYWPIIGLHWKL